MVRQNFPDKMAGAIGTMGRHAGLGPAEGFRLAVQFMLDKLAANGDDTKAALVARKSFHHNPDAALADLRGLVEAFEEAVRAEPFTDHLGSAYMLLASTAGKQAMGQFFTPKVVSSAIAAMALSTPVETDLPYLKAMEPACGGGVMILAAAEVIGQQGMPKKPLIWLAVDLDPLCARMCAVQTAANGIPAVVVCGNTLTWGAPGDETATLIWPPLPDFPEVTQRQAHALLDYLGHEAANIPVEVEPAAS